MAERIKVDREEWTILKTKKLKLKKTLEKKRSDIGVFCF